MDSFPKDSGGTRGGDGAVNILDLIATLRRATSVDSSRPTRGSRGLACVSSDTERTELLRATPEGEQPLGAAERAGAQLELGAPQRGARGTTSIAVYLVARQDLDLAGLGFSLSRADAPADSGALLRFANGRLAPSLADNAIAGTLALAWLDGLWLPAGQRLLLGQVEAEDCGEAACRVQIHGATAVTRAGQTARISWPRPASPARDR